MMNLRTSRAEAMPEELKSGPWPPEEVSQLILAWSHGYSNQDIAKKLNRSENAVAIKASRLRLPPKSTIGEDAGQDADVVPLVKNPKGRMRPCLCCSRQFFSEGAHNRICMTCKEGADWGGSGSYTVHYGSRG